jgi:hypothetical protein
MKNYYSAAMCMCLLGFLARSATAQPSATLTNPNNNTVFLAPAAVPMTATAVPSFGATITGVAFHSSATLLGSATTAPYGFLWNVAIPGTYSLQAKSTDSGAATFASPVASVSVLAAFLANFEGDQGFSSGTLSGQKGWLSSLGSATLTSGNAASGAMAVVLPASLPAARTTHPVATLAGNGVVYYDFFVQPAAAPTPQASSVVSAGGAVVGFSLNGTGATPVPFSGNSTGGGTWLPPLRATDFLLSAGTAQASTWHRLTLREDFLTTKWDMYVDGQMVAYDLGFDTSGGPPSLAFAMTGSVTDPSGLDDLYVGSINPLFINQANDGIDDAWKTTYGLPLAQNLRNASPNGNGVPLINYYATGSSPVDYFAGRALTQNVPTASSTQVTYTYDGSGRISKATFGDLATQDFSFDDAANLTNVATAVQPIVAWRTANAIPLDGSGVGSDSFVGTVNGLTNLAKYAFGLSADAAGTNRFPRVELFKEGALAYMALEYSRPDPAPPDVSYIVEVSSDRQTWASGGLTTVLLSSNTSNGLTTIFVRDATPVTTPTYGRFIRLRLARTSL